MTRGARDGAGPGSRRRPRRSGFALPRGTAITAPVGRLPLRLFNGEAAKPRGVNPRSGKPPPLGADGLNQNTQRAKKNPRRVPRPKGVSRRRRRRTPQMRTRANTTKRKNAAAATAPPRVRAAARNCDNRSRWSLALLYVPGPKKKKRRARTKSERGVCAITRCDCASYLQ